MIGSINVARIKAILFDIDGTLANTDDDYLRRLEALLRPLKFLFPQKSTRQFARSVISHTETPANAIKTMIDRLYIDEVIGTVSDGFHRLRGTNPSNALSLIKDVVPMLQHLHGSYRLGIVTAREQRSSIAFLNHFHLLHFFDCIVTARTTLRSKPHPAPIYHAAKELQVNAGECLMVGDTTVDMRAGSAAGAQTVGVLCGFGQREELFKTGADLLLQSTADLASLFISSSPSRLEMHEDSH